MTTAEIDPPQLAAGTVVLIALDGRAAGGGFERRHYVCRGPELLGGAASFARLDDGASLPQGCDKALVAVYPTRTASDGLGGSLFSDMAPEDRAMIRNLRRRLAGGVSCLKVSLRDTGVFDSLPGYFDGEDQRARYEAQRKEPAPPSETAQGQGRSLVEFDPRFIRQMREIFLSCVTRPNRQDYMWLLTKTFGFNLAVRLAFVVKGVMSGDLPLFRAVVSTSWYQMQDAVFTVFGQTYMKFLGKMTGLLRVHNGNFGDFLFVYVQLCLFEFINRLVLGPIGENPLVYTWAGIGLIFFNILQGMCSGGPIIPAINKMRRAGAISHSTMMHAYQLASLTMHFGLFATFGYQRFYAWLTGVVLALSWTGYVVFTVAFQDPDFSNDKSLLPVLDKAAARCYGL